MAFGGGIRVLLTLFLVSTKSSCCHPDVGISVGIHMDVSVGIGIWMAYLWYTYELLVVDNRSLISFV